MADASQLQLNPYALFDPSQYSNPYSNYQNSALPGASYAGVPYNAMGQPIQPPAGMTINQTPAQPGGGMPQSDASAANANRIWQAAQGAGDGQYMNALMNHGMAPWQTGGMQAAPQAGAPQAGAANSAGLTPQQYMQLRANPGAPGQYGATVPQSASSAQPGSGVLQSFLQNWKPATSGPGAGFQQGFNSAIRGMGY